MLDELRMGLYWFYIALNNKLPVGLSYLADIAMNNKLPAGLTKLEFCGRCLPSLRLKASLECLHAIRLLFGGGVVSTSSPRMLCTLLRFAASRKTLQCVTLP